MTESNLGVLVLSGYNMRAVIAFLRVCTYNNIPVYIVATGKDDPILYTNFASKVVFIRKNKRVEELFDIFLSIKEKNSLDKCFVAPTTEYLNRYLVRNKKEFEKANIFIPLVDEKLYEKVSDKYSFCQLCKENDIDVPKIYDDIETATFPCILKIKQYKDYMGKPIKIEGKKTYNEIVSKSSTKLWFIQEYVSGESYYLLYYFRKDGSYLSFSQKNLIQQSDGGSILLAVPAALHEKPICETYVKMFQKVKFHGLVMVEVKWDGETYKMIEANPRFWGPSQLFVDAGIPFFEEFLRDLGFKTHKPTIEKSVFYYWENGFARSVNEEKYYDYSVKRLEHDYHIIKKFEIYNREDTKHLFRKKGV